jgi:thiosulfate/3-mercaptopyruvate sulfurtransferase
MKAMTSMLAAAVLAVGAGLARAQAGLIVDTYFVEQAAERGAIIWDVRSESEYKKGHIPGAVSIDDPQTQLRDAKSEDYIPIAEMEKLLGEAGIDLTKEIVVYGAKGLPPAYFAQQTLRYLGAERVYVYHGGFDDWKAAGKAVSIERTTLPAVAVHATPKNDLLVSTQEVVAKLNETRVQIVDARTPKEYSGDDIRALRGGHIPGAVNIPYEQNWVDPDTPRKLMRKQVTGKDGMSLKSKEMLAQLYAALDPDKETIVYCQSGSRASETATIMQELGFRDVKIYDGSWLAYGNTFDAPAADISYFNVARVNATLNHLQGRIEALEAELERLKAAARKE